MDAPNDIFCVADEAEQNVIASYERAMRYGRRLRSEVVREIVFTCIEDSCASEDEKLEIAGIVFNRLMSTDDVTIH